MHEEQIDRAEIKVPEDFKNFSKHEERKVFHKFMHHHQLASEGFLALDTLQLRDWFD